MRLGSSCAYYLCESWAAEVVNRLRGRYDNRLAGFFAEETRMTDSQHSPVSKMELSREEIYREWLRIKCATPSYYGLLGVPELESDPLVILHAGTPRRP